MPSRRIAGAGWRLPSAGLSSCHSLHDSILSRWQFTAWSSTSLGPTERKHLEVPQTDPCRADLPPRLPTVGFPSKILANVDVFGMMNSFALLCVNSVLSSAPDNTAESSYVLLLNLHLRSTTTCLKPSGRLASVEMNREKVRTMHKFDPSSTTGKGTDIQIRYMNAHKGLD